MVELSAEDNSLPSVTDFYHGKSIFITGASGFIGSVLLETLLRCFPEIKFIYILLRSKKNVPAEARKEQIFNKKLFQRLKEENPKLLNKVHVIAGDVTLPNLGMSEDDIQQLTEEISIVFHCAANVQFNKPLKFMLLNIVLSLNKVIELCRKMKNFEALVFTSTAYSNCNHTNVILKEEVYRLPLRAEKFLDALKNDDDVELKVLTDHCKPDWPNTYTFSKCLAENVIQDTASDLPVAIIRPSVVLGTLKNPIPGYLEGNFGIVELSLGIGKGFIRVVHCDPNNKLNLVPVDAVANAHVLSAWCVGTKRCQTPMVINCTSTENLKIKISEYCEFLEQFFLKFPLPQSFTNETSCTTQPNKYLYYVLAIYQHYLPAIIFDAYLKITGRKFRLYPLYRFFDKVLSSHTFFSFRIFEFERKNMDYLDKLIHIEDKKDLALDLKDAAFQDMFLNAPEASPFFDWKRDQKCPTERRKMNNRHHIMITCIQGMFMTICLLFFLWLFPLIFY